MGAARNRGGRYPDTGISVFSLICRIYAILGDFLVLTSHSAILMAIHFIIMQLMKRFKANRGSIPTIPTLDKVCGGFGITLAQLFTEDGETPNLTAEQKELLAAWGDLSNEDRKLAKAYIQGLSRK